MDTGYEESHISIEQLEMRDKLHKVYRRDDGEDCVRLDLRIRRTLYPLVFIVRNIDEKTIWVWTFSTRFVAS